MLSAPMRLAPRAHRDECVPGGSAGNLRPRYSIRRSSRRGGRRGKAAAARHVWLRDRRDRRARAADRPRSRRADPGHSFSDADWRRPFRARLGRVRQWRPYPLPRLQRHLSVARTGASERQLGGGDGRGRSGRGQRRRVDCSGGHRLRGSVPALRRGLPSRPGLGPHDLRRDLGNAGRGQAGASGSPANPACPGNRRHDRHGPARHPRRGTVDVEGLRASPSPPGTASLPPSSPRSE